MSVGAAAGNLALDISSTSKEVGSSYMFGCSILEKKKSCIGEEASENGWLPICVL
jgi:hypothetical protein